MAEYSVGGLDEIEQQLAQMVERDFPEEFKRLVFQIAQELLDRTKINTPHITGRLEEGWQIGEVVKVSDEYYIEVWNNVEYAEPVEYGHRDRGGRFIKGSHMLQISMEEISRRLPAFLRDWLSDFLSSHGF